MTKASKRPNVGRMQNAIARDREAGADRRRAQWLASLTPEHRAIHEESQPFCSFCIRESTRRAAEAMDRAMAPLRARAAARQGVIVNGTKADQ